MAILLIFAFISGLVTILAPCIWPLLPIILSASSTGGHRKPLGITVGIAVSFGILTLSISYVIKLIPFDPNILRYFAVLVLAFFGLTFIIPRLSTMVEGRLSRISSSFTPKNNSTGFWGGIVTGLALGVVWTPCAGPILATIATLSATQKVSASLIAVTAVYILGISIPLFLFAFYGRRIFQKSKIFTPHLSQIQKIFGVVMILTALLIFTNYDKILEAKLLDFFPSYSNLLTKLETQPKVQSGLDTLKNQKTQTTNSSLFNASGKAPDFIGVTKWLNTPHPLSISDLQGKVVLVDFWTYTCINCIRTLPHVTSWYNKYHDQGFVVIGVHTPEFEFEKNSNNVLAAIKQYGINYPVPQDNDYSTWNAYQNQYWPAEYLIDVSGNIRRVHFGEGEYDQMEEAIRTLLKDAGKKVNMPLDKISDQTPTQQLSPESYVGSKRMQYYFPDGSIPNGDQNLELADYPSPSSFSFGGEWNIADENATTVKSSVLVYNFYAQKVFLVLKPGSAASKARIFIDGHLADETNSGADVKNGTLTIDSDRLYNLVNLKQAGSHILKIEFENPGTEVFAFTFG